MDKTPQIHSNGVCKPLVRGPDSFVVVLLAGFGLNTSLTRLERQRQGSRHNDDELHRRVGHSGEWPFAIARRRAGPDGGGRI